MDDVSIINILISFSIGCLIGWPIGKLVGLYMVERRYRR